MTVAAVVLAAGSGTRFSGSTHKLLADFRGRPVVEWAISAAAGAGFDQLYVVVGAVDLTDLLPPEATPVFAPQWERGQAHSLAAAVDRATRDGHTAIVVGVGDQPLVPASAWRAVGAARGPIVTATFDGERRPPVKLEQVVWGALPTEGDEGARALFRLSPELVSEVPCSGNPADIDTKEDIARWSSPTNS